MDFPKGPWGDPIWSCEFWYLGSAIPGELGTATITVHVNGLLGEARTFANLKKLRPGDLIIIHVNNSFIDIHFIPDIPRSYHERWDGSGYPRGLKNYLIPLVVCIFSVLDVCNVLSSN